MEKQKMFKFIDNHREEMLDLWRGIVNQESGSSHKEGVDKLQDQIRVFLENEGAQVRIVKYEKAGNMLIAEIGSKRPNPAALFIGHIDTVFSYGTVEKRPFTIKEGKAYGPGVLDMKGGVVAFLYAIKALNAINFSDRPIKVIIAGDEENFHCFTNAAETITEEAKGSIAAFNCETGFIDDAIVIGRKGIAKFEIEVKGVAAHVGNDPENGRNAILEMAHKIIEIEKLTDFNVGTSFNVGIIEGGTVPNATPDYAKIIIDVRFVDENAIPIFTKQLNNIVKTTYVPGTTTTISGGVSFKPMNTTKGVENLFEIVKETSIESGFATPYGKRVGGAADSAYTVIAGVPTVCGMGVKGGRNHSPEEYAIVESLYERSKLLAACVINLDRLK